MAFTVTFYFTIYSLGHNIFDFLAFVLNICWKSRINCRWEWKENNIELISLNSCSLFQREFHKYIIFYGNDLMFSFFITFFPILHVSSINIGLSSRCKHFSISKARLQQFNRIQQNCGDWRNRLFCLMVYDIFLSSMFKRC